MVSTGGDLFQWQRTWRGISTAHGQIDTHRCRYQRTAFNLLSVFTSLAVSSTPSMDILINTCFEHITALHISAREEISSSGACCWPMAHTVSHRDVLCLNLAWVLCCMSSSTLCPLIGPFCTVSYQKKAGVFLYCFIINKSYKKTKIINMFVLLLKEKYSVFIPVRQIWSFSQEPVSLA